MSSHFRVKNEFGLTGENLAYYQDIQYLKELTKQATALMSRSNAVYNNILNELDIGHSTGGANASSLLELGKSQDDGRCNQCGLSHGADYCILQQILTEEQPEATQDRFSGKMSREISMSTFQPSRLGRESRNSSWPIEEFSSPLEKKVQVSESKNLTNLPVFEDLTPEELLDTYEMICKRYGENNGKRFLLAHSLANNKDAKIEPWTVPCDARPEKVAESPPKISYKKIRKECFPEAVQFNPLCTDYSDEVRRKVETLVQLIPPCDADALKTSKNWKGIFKKGRREVREEVPHRKDDSSDTTLAPGVKFHALTCKCIMEDCDCVGDTTCMKSPKYVCEKDENIGVNYLVTVRNRMERRRRCVESERSTMAVSRDLQIQDNRLNKKQTDFLQRAFEEQERQLNQCLTRDTMVEQSSNFDSVEFHKNIQNVTDLSAPMKMIEEHVWKNWMNSYDKREAEIMQSDKESESVDSQIESEWSGSTENSRESDLDCRERKELVTRIPFAEECYKLTDILFDKINSHFERSIQKNVLKTDTLSYMPSFADVLAKIKLLESSNKIFHDLVHYLHYLRPYPKRLKPFHITKQSKMRRLEGLVRKCKQVDSRRKWSQGTQIGKPYRRCDKEVKYTRDGNLEGFSENKRKYLNKPEWYRIKSYNLVGDVSGRSINKKRIHKDFMLIRNLFDDESESRRRRESMMDQGMKKRFEMRRRRVLGLSKEILPETPGPISNVDGSTLDLDSESAHSTVTQNVPKKEEMGLERTAPKKWQINLHSGKKGYSSSRPRESSCNILNMKRSGSNTDRNIDTLQHDEEHDGIHLRKTSERIAQLSRKNVKVVQPDQYCRRKNWCSRPPTAYCNLPKMKRSGNNEDINSNIPHHDVGADGKDFGEASERIAEFSRQSLKDVQFDRYGQRKKSSSSRPWEPSCYLPNMKTSGSNADRNSDVPQHDGEADRKDVRKASDRIDRNASSSSERMKNTSKGTRTPQSAAVMSRLATYAMKCQNIVPSNCKRSSVSSRIESLQNKHDGKQPKSSITESLSSKRTLSTMSKEDRKSGSQQTNKTLASLELMSPVKTSFDDFQTDGEKRKTVSLISVTSIHEKLAAGLS